MSDTGLDFYSHLADIGLVTDVPPPVRGLAAARLAVLLGSWRSARPAYVALAERIRLLLLDGRLPLHLRLPAERELSTVLAVSRTTVAGAYEQLRQQGFLASRRGAGSWTTLPADASRHPWHVTRASDAAEDRNVIDLTQAAPQAPSGALHAAVSAAAARLPAHLPTSGYELLGLPDLRSAIAGWYDERGLPTSRDQILVTNGAQHGFALVLRLLVSPGDRVVLEEPTYPNAVLAVRQAAGRPVAVPTGPTGLDLDVLAAVSRQHSPVLAYLIPDFQNPTGSLLGTPGRQRALDLLRRGRATVVVDETLVDLRLDGPAVPPPVAAHDRDGSVVTLGSLSKSCWGGLRVGWVRATPDLVARLAGIRPGGDLGNPVLEQLVATELLGHLDDVLPGRRADLLRHRDSLAAALAEQAPDWRFPTPGGGLSLWVDLGGACSSALAVAAERHGLRLAPGPRFAVGAGTPLERFVRIPYTAPEPVLSDAVRRLVTAWASLPEKDAPRHDVSLVT